MNDLIRSAIEVPLSAWAMEQDPMLQVSWENVAFQPPQAPHLRGFLLPAGTDNPTMGNTLERHIGIYQVSVYGLAGQSTGAVERLAGQVARLFPRGSALPDAGGTIKVIFERTPSVGAGRPSADGFYFVPVSIRYRADIFT